VAKLQSEAVELQDQHGMLCELMDFLISAKVFKQDLEIRANNVVETMR
jgi:hypothetical protein